MVAIVNVTATVILKGQGSHTEVLGGDYSKVLLRSFTQAMEPLGSEDSLAIAWRIGERPHALKFHELHF